jgi:hypothetical protein
MIDLKDEMHGLTKQEAEAEQRLLERLALIRKESWSATDYRLSADEASELASLIEGRRVVTAKLCEQLRDAETLYDKNRNHACTVLKNGFGIDAGGTSRIIDVLLVLGAHIQKMKAELEQAKHVLGND